MSLPQDPSLISLSLSLLSLMAINKSNLVSNGTQEHLPALPHLQLQEARKVQFVEKRVS